MQISYPGKGDQRCLSRNSYRIGNNRSPIEHLPTHRHRRYGSNLGRNHLRNLHLPSRRWHLRQRQVLWWHCPSRRRWQIRSHYAPWKSTDHLRHLNPSRHLQRRVSSLRRRQGRHSQPRHIGPGSLYTPIDTPRTPPWRYYRP